MAMHWLEPRKKFRASLSAKAAMLRVGERHDAHGLPSQIGAHLLFDARKEAIEVQIKALDFGRKAHVSAFTGVRANKNITRTIVKARKPVCAGPRK